MQSHDLLAVAAEGGRKESKRFEEESMAVAGLKVEAVTGQGNGKLSPTAPRN